jgi:glucose/mannose transport system permease protein
MDSPETRISRVMGSALEVSGPEEGLGQVSMAHTGKAATRSPGRLWGWWQIHLPKLMVAPSLAISLVVVYGFMLWTGWISLTTSKVMPTNEWAGLDQYVRVWANPLWRIAVNNIFIFAALFISFSVFIGCVLAILLDQRIRFEGVLRTIYLYPMALSFIVTGTAWKWILNPGLGLEHLVQSMGWTSFHFDWLVNPNYAIYTVVIAAVWQSSGFVMAMFLAGLRGIDDEIIKAARLDGASMVKVYFRVILPMLAPTFMTAFVILTHLSVKSFDLVVALTSGGPANSTQLPATFMYTQTFARNNLGVGAASAVMIFMTVAAIIVPYLYSEIRRSSHVR